MKQIRGQGGRRAIASCGAVVSLVLGAVVLAGWVAPAGASVAKGCDPAYGCTPTTPPPGVEPSCTIDVTAAAPGATVTATLRNVPVGSHVRLLFDGAQVAEGDTTASGTSGSVTLTFTVPT